MKEFFRNTWQHRALVVLALPVFLVLLFINYIPMSGLILAFENFDYTKGIFGSPLIGLKNFEFLLQSKDVFIRMLSNTLLYYVIFTFIGQFLNVVLAISIDQFSRKRLGKIMQTVMIMPVFVSYAAVQFIVMAYLSSGTGIINNLLGTNIPFYR
ncbi:MAG: sugar ABC transporter permease, partial [Clostridia bacterium]|nr:sugar ABC transporter permease [Clostridia bacterium]